MDGEEWIVSAVSHRLQVAGDTAVGLGILLGPEAARHLLFHFAHAKYDPKSIPPWPNFDETFEGKPAAHLRKHQEWHLEDKDWSWWQNVVSKYYGDVSLIDDCVGRVLDAIQECGIEDDTIFVFSTDHGDATGSHKHFEKSGTMYDEVFRIPRFLRKCPVRLPDRHQSLFALWI